MKNGDETVNHKFDANNKSKLDSEKRRKILPPSEILRELGLKEGDTMADIGCGIGYFSIPASLIVGDCGKVYAIDVSVEMLEEVERRVKQNNIDNVVSIHSEETNFKLDDDYVTYGFTCNVLHEIDDKKAFLMEARRIIKENGKIAIVEWQKIQTGFGPPVEHRIGKEEAQNLLKDLGFNNITCMDIGEHHYGVTGEK